MEPLCGYCLILQHFENAPESSMGFIWDEKGVSLSFLSVTLTYSLALFIFIDKAQEVRQEIFTSILFGCGDHKVTSRQSQIRGRVIPSAFTQMVFVFAAQSLPPWAQSLPPWVVSHYFCPCLYPFKHQISPTEFWSPETNRQTDKTAKIVQGISTNLDS